MIYAIYLINGNVETFDTLRKFKDYESDFDPVIKSKKEFKTKKEFETYEKARKKTELEEKSDKQNEGDEAMPLSIREAIAKIKADIDLERPGPKLELIYRIHKTSRKFGVIVRHLDSHGEEFWLYKPEKMVPLIRTYVTLHPQNDEYIQTGLENMEFGHARDPDSNDPNQEKKAKNVTKGVVTLTPYSVYSAYTIMESPPFQNREEEKTWIEEKLKEFGIALLKIQVDEEIQETFSTMVSPKFLSLCSRETPTGYNLWTYLQSAIVVTNETNSYNKYLIKTHSDTVQTEVLKKTITEKYSTQDKDKDEDKDSENSDSNSDDEEDDDNNEDDEEED